jgi:hypothetical protein
MSKLDALVTSPRGEEVAAAAHETEQPSPLLRPLGWVSRLLPPALVLAVVVLLSGIRSDLGLLGALALTVGVVVVPGLIYLAVKPIFLKYNIPTERRVVLVAVLMVIATAICFAIPLPALVSHTVAGLLLGNVALLVLRRWLNVSAHVSVVTYALVWFMSVYGIGWWPLLLLSPMMLFSRVHLKEHTWTEALAGAGLGLATFYCFVVSTTWSWNL